MEPRGSLRYRSPTAHSATSSSSSSSSDSQTLNETPRPESPEPTRQTFIFKFLGSLLGLFERQQDVSDDRFSNRTVEKIEDYPLGYPRFAAWVNTDESFAVFRRFGTLRSRVILHRQHELVQLEKKLFELDKEDGEKNKHRITSIRRDAEDAESGRRALIDEIDFKLKKYDKLLERERRSLQLQKPTSHNYQSLINFIWNRKPIVHSETAFLNPCDDFIVLAEEQDTRLGIYIEFLVNKLLPSKWFWGRFLTTIDQRKKTDDEYVTLVDRNRVQILIRLLTILFSGVSVGGPLLLLVILKTSDAIKCVIVIVSMLIFAGGISILGTPRNHELFIAAATYTAVLVVFLDKASNL